MLESLDLMRLAEFIARHPLVVFISLMVIVPYATMLVWSRAVRRSFRPDERNKRPQQLIHILTPLIDAVMQLGAFHVHRFADQPRYALSRSGSVASGLGCRQ